MNPVKAFSHLFSPLGGTEADNYRTPGQLSFLRAPFVPVFSDELKEACLLYTSPSPRDTERSRMPSSA